MEYCSVVWYDNLSQAQSNAIERLHIVAIKIILGRDCPYKGDGHFDYIKALIICNLDYLFSRREKRALDLGKKLFPVNPAISQEPGTVSFSK